MRWNVLLGLAILSTLSGCTSFSSTSLKRFDDNSYSGESNGVTKMHGQARPFKGIPITLKVPTHLDIYIDEVYFVKLTRDSATELLGGTSRLLQVRTELIKSDKVFTVDFKRPASGYLDLDLTFDEDEQYFKKIVSKLQDDTITDVGKLVETSIKSFSALPSSINTTPKMLEDMLEVAKIETDSRVVAFQRFDINSPSFEQDVECFVNRHLNDCNECSSKPTYDR